LVLGLIFSSCGGNSSEDEKLKLEKEKLELEKKKLELEKEKMGSGSDQDNSTKSDESEKTEERQVYISQPSENRQVDVIRNFYSDFDYAYDYNSMNAFINRYYNSTLKAKYSKTELPSYDDYNSKEHQIIDISVINETKATREFKIIFYFNFERADGKSGSNKCADKITLDNGNKIVARTELGRVN